MAESRVKKTLLNARVNLIFYFLTLVLSFFSRKIFLDCLGASFVGLTGTLQNLLGFLNLAELGIGSAIGYLLYKPLFEDDRTSINEIISVMGYVYRVIGLIILLGGCILGCFLPLIFPYDDTGFHLPLIYFAYFSFLASSLIGYFINYRQNLLAADQRNYIVAAYFQTNMILKTIAQIISAYYTKSYYLWVAIELIFGIVYSFILNYKINQTYPWLNADIKLGRRVFRKYPEVLKYTKQLFVHKISGFAQSQVTPILIYAFVSLSTVAYFTNYKIIIDRVNLLVGNILGSASAGIGNLIAEGNQKKILKVFGEYSALQFFINGIVLFGLFAFTNPLISLWLGNQYILDNIVLYLLLVIFYFGMIRNINDPFIFGSGMFYDTWAPLTEATIYIIVALVGGYVWGLPGVLLGNVVSLACIIGCWKPYFLFRKGLNAPISEYIKTTLLRTTLMVLLILGLYKLLKKYAYETISEDWFSLILYGPLWILSFAILYFILMYIVDTYFRIFVGRFLKRKFIFR